MTSSADCLFARRNVLKLGAALASSALLPAAFAKSLTTAQFGWELHKPEEAGLSALGLANVHAAVRLHLDSNEPTGAVTARNRCPRTTSRSR